MSDKKEIQTIKDLQDANSELMFGTSAKADNDLYDKVRDTMSKISSAYKRETGNNITEFFSRVEMLKSGGGGGRKSIKGKGKVNVNDLVDNADTGVVNDIFYSEKDRVQLYHSFDQIYDLIPQMAMALDTFVDNIISPDDFTKTSFNIEYTNVTATEQKKNEVAKRLTEIKKKYLLERLQPKIIRNTMKKGDNFVAVLGYGDEIGKMLKEENAFRDETREYEEMYYTNHILTEASVSDDDKVLLNEFKEIEDITNTGKKSEDNIDWAEEIKIFFQESVIMSRDPSVLLYEAGNDAKEIKDKETKDGTFELSGSILRILDPQRVIKLNLDNVDYGYYYVDQIGANTQFGTTHSLGNNRFRDLITTNIGAPDPVADQIKGAKLRLISNIFSKNVASKIDRKFVKDNPEFKNIIYGILKTNYDKDQKLRITYIPPDKMVHFRSEGDSIYGRSAYSPVLFTAKLYLASLISTLMQKLVRAPEKRIFYIETGLDEDTPGAIQSFVKSIKSKEFKTSDLGDITSALNSVGTFNDLYIPMQNGEKTIEVDALPGQDVSIENDFLDYLRRSMISGMGIPAAFLGYSDEVEFARSLTMMNGRFVRSVISWQSVFAEQFTQMVRMIYKSEYSSLEEYEEGDLDKLEVKFSKPMTLLSASMNDMVNNVNSILEFITAAMIGDVDIDPNAKRIFRIESLKKLMPGVEWEEFKELFEASIIQANQEATKKKAIEDLNNKEGEAADQPAEGMDVGGGGDDENAGTDEDAPSSDDEDIN
jgi:hypothetical protein